MQDLIGIEFAELGTVSTFSWLGPEYRGRGIGTEMRTAVLHLAFDGFGAQEAASEAFTDNEASNRVSEMLGYQPNGTGWATRRGDPARVRRWKLTRGPVGHPAPRRHHRQRRRGVPAGAGALAQVRRGGRPALEVVGDAQPHRAVHLVFS